MRSTRIHWSIFGLLALIASMAGGCSSSADTAATDEDGTPTQHAAVSAKASPAAKPKAAAANTEAARAKKSAAGGAATASAVSAPAPKAREPWEEEASTLEGVVDYHATRWLYTYAREKQKELVALYRKHLGAKHWKTRGALAMLATLERMEAFTPEQREQVKLLNSMAGPGSSLYARGRFGELAPLADRALEIAREIYGDDPLNTARLIAIRAECHWRQGEWADAERLTQQALEIDKKVLGEEHPDTSTMMYALAMVYGEQAQYAKAEALLKQCLAAEEKSLGKEDPRYARTLAYLGMMYMRSGDLKKAEPLLRSAMAITEKSNSVDSAECLHQWGVYLSKKGKNVEAEKALRGAMEAAQRVYPPAHPNLTAIVGDYVRILRVLGRQAEAEAVLSRFQATQQEAVAARTSTPPGECVFSDSGLRSLQAKPERGGSNPTGQSLKADAVTEALRSVSKGPQTDASPPIKR